MMHRAGASRTSQHTEPLQRRATSPRDEALPAGRADDSAEAVAAENPVACTGAGCWGATRGRLGDELQGGDRAIGESSPSLDVLVPAWPTGVAELHHDLAVELHRGAQHGAGRRPEIHRAVPHGEVSRTGGVDDGVVSGVARLARDVVGLHRHTDLHEHPRRCLQPQRAVAGGVLLARGADRLLALQQAPCTDIGDALLRRGLVLIWRLRANTSGGADSVPRAHQRHSGRREVLLAHEYDGLGLGRGQSSPSHANFVQHQAEDRGRADGGHALGIGAGSYGSDLQGDPWPVDGRTHRWRHRSQRRLRNDHGCGARRAGGQGGDASIRATFAPGRRQRCRQPVESLPAGRARRQGHDGEALRAQGMQPERSRDASHGIGRQPFAADARL
mmetsp:Transcript_77483/g.224837  ORF Transcript_77483/g.224837 Transcript_77483/m.224837 type:complete len:388 (+) Transcript_77483:208-1371(+)